MIDLLAIRAGGIDIPAGALSGGNQQKVVIAKWLMAEPRIILLNDPTRGIDVATKQEIYQLLRRLADSGAAIIFYTTDYSELIGCCDRAWCSTTARSSGCWSATRSPSAPSSAAPSTSPKKRTKRVGGAGPMSDWRYALAQNRGTLIAFAFFVVMFAIYSSNHPAGFSANVVQTAANKGVLLALVAMAQTFVVITAGIDLSVGAVFVLTNCLASWIVVGNRGDGRARRRRRSRGRPCLRRGQRPHRHCRSPAADRHDDRDRRGLLRPRAHPAPDARRRRLRPAGRRA